MKTFNQKINKLDLGGSENHFLVNYNIGFGIHIEFPNQRKIITYSNDNLKKILIGNNNKNNKDDNIYKSRSSKKKSDLYLN